MCFGRETRGHGNTCSMVNVIWIVCPSRMWTIHHSQIKVCPYLTYSKPCEELIKITMSTCTHETTKKTAYCYYHCFLGAFTKLRKATISFVMSVGLPVSAHGTPQVPPDRFTWNLIWDSSKICRANASFVKILQELPLLYIQIYYVYEGISLNSSRNEKCFRKKWWRKSEHAFFYWVLFTPTHALFHTTMYQSFKFY